MRTLLVEGKDTFKIEIPDEARVTFGPFSPPSAKEARYGGETRGSAVGTLRIYDGATKAKESILGMFSGVTSFRDIGSIEYAKEVAKEEGATMWKSDSKGYVREEKVQRSSEWVKSGPDGLLETTEDGEDNSF